MVIQHLTHAVASKKLNSVTVSWSAANGCDAVWYSLNSGAWTSVTYGASYTITGLTPNTTYTVKTRVRRTDTQSLNESAVLNVTTYDYAKITGANNCTDEENPKVFYSFVDQSGITLNIRLELVSPQATIVNNAGWPETNSYEFLLNSTQKTQIYTKCGVL